MTDTARATAAASPSASSARASSGREDVRILTGTGHYVDDVQLPGMLHAAFLRSPIAHGRITAIDVSAGRAGARRRRRVRPAPSCRRCSRPTPSHPACSDRRRCRSRCWRPTRSGWSAIPSPWSWPRAATSPRTPSSCIEVDYDELAPDRHRRAGARPVEPADLRGPRVERRRRPDDEHPRRRRGRVRQGRPDRAGRPRRSTATRTCRWSAAASSPTTTPTTGQLTIHGSNQGVGIAKMALSRPARHAGGARCACWPATSAARSA